MLKTKLIDNCHWEVQWLIETIKVRRARIGKVYMYVYSLDVCMLEGCLAILKRLKCSRVFIVTLNYFTINHIIFFIKRK